MLRRAISASLTLIPLAAARVEDAVHCQPCRGRGRGNQVHDGRMTRERVAAPILGEVAEQAVLDLVPLRGAGRIVTDRDRQPGLVGKLLQLELPQPNPNSIGTAAVGRDQQPLGTRIALAPDPLVPGPDGVDRELGRVSAYGRVLRAKIALFGLTLVLA